MGTLIKVMSSSLLALALLLNVMDSRATERDDGPRGAATAESVSTLPPGQETTPPASTTPRRLPVAVQFLIAEGLLVVNAGIAAEAPEAYGSVMLLFTPLVAFPKNRHEAVFFSLALGLFLYDIIAPSTFDLTPEEIFIHNIAAWNALLAVNVAVEQLFGEQRLSGAPSQRPDSSLEAPEQAERPQFHAGLAPLGNGVALCILCRF